MDFIKQLLKLIKPFIPKIKILLAVLLLFEVIRLINPYLFKVVIDELVVFKAENLRHILYLLGLIFLAENFLVLIDNLADRSIVKLINNLEKYLLSQAHDKLLELSLDYHEKENTGDKVSRIERGVDRLLDLISNSLWEFLPTVFQIVITFGAILWLNWVLAIIYLVFIPPYVWLSYLMSKKQRPFRKKINKLYEKSSGLLSEDMLNIQTIQGYTSENSEKKRYHGILQDLIDRHWLSFKLFLNYNWRRSVWINLARFTLLIVGVIWTARGIITPGGLVMFITLSEKVYISLFRLFRVFDRLMESKETANRLTMLLTTQPTVKNDEAAISKKLEGRVEFRNIHFCYSSGYYALKNLSFTIKPGERVAIVGPSGSGKTTITKLIYRHYEPSSGKILIDGVDLKKLDLSNYRNQLGIVTQEVGIFNRTVRENIAYGIANANQDKIEEAAKLAQAYDFIMKLPQGYNTLVGERGIKLSGGQRQRIGIARAIIRDPKILIFDEATNSLDAESEAEIQKAIKIISQGRTMIVIAHRLSTIKYMDKILVIENGRLVEEGTHDELIRKTGLYYRLSKLQSDYQLRV